MTTNTLSRWAFVCLTFALATLAAEPLNAGTLSYFPITGDGDSQISAAKTYTHALDFGNQSGFPVATINGVVFDDGNPGPFPAPPIGSATVGTGSTNQGSDHGGSGSTNVSGNLHNLLGDMTYDNNNTVVQVSGLTIGQTYDFRLYNRQWSLFDRTQQFGFDANGLGGPEASVVLNPDDAFQNPPGLDAANRAFAISYAYTAWSPTLTVTIDRLGDGTYHMYGLTNEVTGPVIAAEVHPITRLRSTGVDDGGNVLAAGSSDPHYEITSVPGGGSFGPAVVQANHPAWLANDPVGTPGSSWTSVVPVGTTGIPGGNYVSETTFNLFGWDHATTSIQGSVSVDNNLDDVILNGQSLGISAAGFGGFTDFEIPAGSGFVNGENKLEFLWRNADAVSGPGGLRLELQAFAERGKVQAIPGLFNTGVDDNGVSLPNDPGAIDPHYAITVNPDGGGPGAHVEDETAFPIAGPWLNNSATSKWIAPRFNTSGAAGGAYAYETTFNLAGYYADTAEISGAWASDDGGVDILLNGAVVHTGNSGFGGLVPFTIPVGGPFIQGLNTLTFRLNNGSTGYTGLRVENLMGTAVAVPEPASLGLLVLGGLGLVLLGRRRLGPR